MPRTIKKTAEKKDKKLTSNTISNSSKKKLASSEVSKKSSSSTNRKTSKTSKKSNTSSKSATTSATKKVVSKKTPSKKAVNKTEKINLLEYYDLPYRYNQTVIKVLYQTPKTLFVYWDISDEDRASYIKQYGDNFFNNTKPVLIIHNITMNYTFEIEINDFANCWYFNINDEKCEYSVELGRRPKNNNIISVPNNYLYITSSNKIESPNGHILFEKNQKVIFYKNVKTNETFSKNIANLSFIKYLGKLYNTYDMYKKIYNDEEILDINNPTSSFK